MDPSGLGLGDFLFLAQQVCVGCTGVLGFRDQGCVEGYPKP